MKMFRTKILCITRDSNTGIYQINLLYCTCRYLFKFYSVEEMESGFLMPVMGF